MGTYSGFSYHIAPRALDQEREFSPGILFADSVRHVISGHVPADQYFRISSTNAARNLKEGVLERRMRELFSIDLNPLIAMTRQLDSEPKLFRAWNTWQKHTRLAVSTVIHGGTNQQVVIEREKVPNELDPPPAREAALCAFKILKDAATLRQTQGERWIPVRLSQVASHLGLRDCAVKDTLLCLEERNAMKVGKLCKSLGCHPRTLERHLKAAGIAAMDLKMACALIGATNHLWGDKPLTDIAFENGFSDQAHMTRAFRKACGIPPSVLRSLALPLVPESHSALR